jgi:hypothetical protein
MSFDLRNAAKTFERFVDEVLSGFDFCFAYIADMLVYSRTPKEYEQQIRTLFKQLQAYGILFKAGKCVFSMSLLTPLYVYSDAVNIGEIWFCSVKQKSLLYTVFKFVSS